MRPKSEPGFFFGSLVFSWCPTNESAFELIVIKDPIMPRLLSGSWSGRQRVIFTI